MVVLYLEVGRLGVRELSFRGRWEEALSGSAALWYDGRRFVPPDFCCAFRKDYRKKE